MLENPARGTEEICDGRLPAGVPPAGRGDHSGVSKRHRAAEGPVARSVCDIAAMQTRRASLRLLLGRWDPSSVQAG